MASAGITALLKKMDYHDVVVAIDGSVYRHHPHFPNIMRSHDENGVLRKIFKHLLNIEGRC